MAEDILLERKKDILYFRKISSKSEIDNSKDYDGYLIRANENESRKIISSLKGSNFKGKIAIYGSDEQTNRRFIETLNFDYLVSPEINPGKDSLKQRSSGLNHVLIREARKKGIAILISLGELEKLKTLDKVKVISRIIQNVKLCRKVNCEMKIANLDSPKRLTKKERIFLGTSWGMSSQQLRDCCSF